MQPCFTFSSVVYIKPLLSDRWHDSTRADASGTPRCPRVNGGSLRINFNTRRLRLIAIATKFPRPCPVTGLEAEDSRGHLIRPAAPTCRSRFAAEQRSSAHETSEGAAVAM